MDKVILYLLVVQKKFLVDGEHIHQRKNLYRVLIDMLDAFVVDAEIVQHRIQRDHLTRVDVGDQIDVVPHVRVRDFPHFVADGGNRVPNVGVPILGLPLNGPLETLTELAVVYETAQRFRKVETAVAHSDHATYALDCT